jgi:hypothetical protein
MNIKSNMNHNNPKNSEIMKHNMDLQLLLAQLKKDESSLKEHLEIIKKEQDELTKSKSFLDLECENIKKSFQQVLKQNSDFRDKTLNEELINMKCEHVINSLLIDINKGRLMYKIEYNKHYHPMEIDYNSTKTFKKLKTDIKLLFNKRENEFFLADDRGIIFMDELNVRTCLFPLRNVNIKNNEPVVRVIDKKNALVQLITNKNNKLSKEEEENAIKAIPTPPKKATRNIFEIFSLIFFIIFVLIWSTLAMEMRNVSQSNVFVSTFRSFTNNLDQSLTEWK